MTKLKTRLPIKALAVLMAILMIFSTISVMFTASAALSDQEGGGEGVWYSSMLNKTLSITGEYLSSSGTLNSTARSYNVHYAVYLPKGYEDNYAEYRANGKKLATMLVISGGSSTLNAGDSSYSAMARITGLNYLADEQGIVLIYLRMSNTSLNANYYWNFFLDTYQERNNSRPLGQITAMVDSVKTTLNNDFDDIITQDGKKRTYVAGFSAGACLASNMIAVYPDRYEGAAIVAGMPYRMFRSTASGYTYGGYANAMYGGDGNTKNYDSWSSYGYSWNRQSVSTYGNHLSTAWNTAGVSNAATNANAPRIIVLHGEADNVVDLRNGEQNASAIAIAMGATTKTGSGVNERVTFPNSEEKDGYTAYYYGLNSSLLGDVNTSVGYSKARASRLAFMTFDGLGHKWVSDYSQALESGNESNSSAMGGKDDRYNYNNIIWDFFEGVPSYFEAGPVEPDGEPINPSYAARFGTDGGIKVADLVSAQGLAVTDKTLAPKYLVADTNSATGTEWNFNFDLTSLINKEAAFITDPRYKLTVESIKVYQNVWVSADGATVNIGYDVIDNAVITQGGSNAVALNGVTKLASWTGTPKFQTKQFVTEIPISDEFSEELIEKKVLSIVNYGDNADYNVASPVIVVTFGQTLSDPTQKIPGDGNTKTSVKLFPSFAYNSAAGYNAPDSAANETKHYSGIEGHLIGTAKKYSVGVYNAGDNNDKIYYSFDMWDYTILNNKAIQSITIDFALEGNPYYSKEDVKVVVKAMGNMYWDAAGAQPTEGYITLPETYTLSKGERIEGQIVISGANILNRVNNLGGFTLVFENDAKNSHYYFLATMPTITVAYENAKGKPVTPLMGVGSRTELGYDDFVANDSLFESGETTVNDKLTIASPEINDYRYSTDTGGNEISSGNLTKPNSLSSNAINNVGNTFSAYNVYDGVEDQIMNAIMAKYPGMTEGVDYWVTIEEIKLTKATVTVPTKLENNSYPGTTYVYYNKSLQSNGTVSAFSSTNSTLITSEAVSSTTEKKISATFEPNFVLDSSNQYLWLKAWGDPTTTSQVSNRQTLVGIPTLSDLEYSYSATVTMTPPVIVPDSGSGTIESVEASGPLGYTQATQNANTQNLTSSATTTGNNYYATVAGFDLYNAAYNQVISELKTKYNLSDGEISEKVTNLTIRFTEVTASIKTYENNSGRTDPTASIRYSRPSDASAYNNRGSFTTNSTGTTVNWTVTGGSSSSPLLKEQTITLDDNHQFTEDNPYMLIRAYTNRVGSYNQYNYAMLNVPQLSDLKFTWSADIEVPNGEGGAGGGDDEDKEFIVEPDIPSTPPGQTIDGEKVSGSVAVSATSVYYTTNVQNRTSTSESSWTNNATTKYTSGNIYGLIMNYNIGGIKDSIAAELKSTLTAPAGMILADVEVTFTSLVLTGTCQNSTYNRTLNVSSTDNEYKAYNSAMANWTAIRNAGSPYTLTIPSISDYTNEFINIYCGGSNSNYALSSIPEASLTYEYTPKYVAVSDALQTVTTGTDESTRITRFAIVTTTSATSVQIKANGSLVKEYSSFTTVNGYNVFVVDITVPTVDTTYTIYALENGVAGAKTISVGVEGIPEPVVPDEPEEPEQPDVLMDAAGNKLTGVVNGGSYKVPENTYDETRTVTSTSSQPTTTNIFPVNGYIVGTNERYYTNNSADYWTGPNRSTGSPQANVALDTTKTSFPVSYLGYAYMNYDVSSYFDREESKKLISDNSSNPEVTTDPNTGITTKVITKVYQETVVSGIRVNTIKAQEGYTGGWANRYTVDGNSYVKAGNEWTSTNKPTNYQPLGNGSVTSTMGVIGNAANLNDGQLALAREDGFVTVWVNNTGCDWSRTYYPSAWLLVEVPTISVTYKTITYTEKEITETKKVTQATTSSYSDKITSNTSATADIQNGYLYGAEGKGTTAYRQTYGGMWNSTPSNDTGEHYFTTSAGGSSSSQKTYRTATTTEKEYFMAQANVEMNSTSLSGGKFAVTYMGSGYAEYNLSDLLSTEVKSEVTGTTTTTGVINGKETEVIQETIRHTQNKVKSITFSISTQAGFTGNNTANDYNVTNVFYMGSFADWSGNSYPNNSDTGWSTIATVSNIKINAKTTNVTISAEENSDVFNALLRNGYLTVRVDNTYNDWDNSYQGSAWTLITLADVTVNYESQTWTETKLTATKATDTFAPNYEVYAQYRFTGANGESFSKTKLLGEMTGYGARGTVTPYIVADGATHGTINALFTSPVKEGDKPTNSVVITEKESDNESYKLKRAYIEQTGQDIAILQDNGNGTYLLDTTLTSDMIKTNEVYKIRIIFEYESEAETPIPESEQVKVNLHSVFEEYDANGNMTQTVGQLDSYAFAKLTDLSYVLSLDDAVIPFGDCTLSNGKVVSATAGSNRIYTLDIDKTQVQLGSLTTMKTGTNEFATSNYEAKAYLDVTGNTPALGDVLVVTYNGGDATGDIDVYLYYKTTPQYDVTVNYEFDIVDENGNSLSTQKYTYNKEFPMSIGEIILPYDALSTETEDFTSVSLTLKGENAAKTYQVGQFGDPTITATNGIKFDEDTLMITDISSDGTITFKYQMVMKTNTNVTVNHQYVVNYGGNSYTVTLSDKTTGVITAPYGGSIDVIRDNTAIDVDIEDYMYHFVASQFTPVRVESSVQGIEFGTYAFDGVFTATKVPYNTDSAVLTIVYELNVNKVTVIEKFAQNGVIADGQETTTVFVPANSSYSFVSAFPADSQPFNDGITLDKYTATSSDVTLNSDKGGSTSFDIISLNADKTVTIVYDYATNAQVDINVKHEFYENGNFVGSTTEFGATLTNPGKGVNSYTVVPFSGTVTGITGSISSAIVDANNYYANGMSSASGDVSINGYTVTYTNSNTTGTQPAIDVIVRYDISDTAFATVEHEYYINGEKVTANVTNNPTTALNLTKGQAQSITVAQGTVTYNGTTFNLSDFTKVATSSNNEVFGVNGFNVTLNKFNVTETGKVTVRYDLTVREITVTEIFKDSTSTLGTETSKLYVANGKSYTFTSKFNSYNGIDVTNFGREISAGYTLGAGVPATFTSTASGDANVTITYTVGTQANVTVKHEYYINGQPVSADVTNAPTTNLVLNKGVAQTITTAQGTVNFHGTTFNLSDFTVDTYGVSNGLSVNGLNVTLNAFNVATGELTVRYNLLVATITVTEIFAKDAVTVETATKTAYVKVGNGYTFTSDYKSGSIISDVALGDYIRTAQGADVTTAANGAATFTIANVSTAGANVTINYAVSTKTTADVEYVYIVNGGQISVDTITDGDPTMNLVYGQAVAAPSATGYYTLTGTNYSIGDFKKTVTVTAGDATVVNNEVILNAYNVANGTVKVTVTYEITISKEAPANVYHTYYINGVELTGDALANVTAGTTSLNLVYGESQTINKSTGTVNYNGTEFNLSQFDTTVTCSDALSMNGFDVTLIKYNVGAQNVTVRYDLTVYTVVVNEVFNINGVQADTVTNTYYVSAKDAALTAGLVNGSTTVNGIAVSNFIASVSDNSDAIDGTITAGNYVATVNGNGIVTIEYNVSTKTNVNITSIFKVNGSTDGIDTSNVTNAVATQTFEYGKSTPVTSLAGGYVIWNGTKLNVSDFTASITNYDPAVIAASGLNVTVNKYNTEATDIVITYTITVRSVTLTENFIVDNVTVESQVTTKYYPINSAYVFVSNYGNDYVPAGTSIALSNFTVYGGVKNSDGFVEITGTATENAAFTVDYKVTTKAYATVTHKYFFNGEEITPVITAEGSSGLNLTYGVSTPIVLSQGTHVFNGKTFNLSDADITVTSSNANVAVDGTNVMLNAYNQTATDIVVEYHLSTVVVNITEVVVTDDGAHTLTLGEHTFYLLDNEVFSSFTSTFDTVKVNGVTIPYSLFTRTVTGAEDFAVEQTNAAITISGLTAGQNANIVITYSGVKTTGNVRIASRYYYKNGSTVGMTQATTGYDYTQYVTVNVGDRIKLSDYKDITFKVSNASQTINTSHFYAAEITANGFNGYVDEETNEFVVTSIEPNMAGVSTDIFVKWCIDLYADVSVVHEFYVNNRLFTTVTETQTEVPIMAANGTTSSKLKIAQMKSGTISANGTSYNIAELIANGTLIVDDSLVKTTGLTVARGTNKKDYFIVQSYDIPIGDNCEVVIRYDITTTLEEADVTVNSTYVNNGEYVGSLSNSVVTNLKIGDVIANETVKTINGVEVTFAVESVVGNGVTIVNENGVYTITEIDPKATELSIDITYVATVTAFVKLTHNFYVAGKLVGTITDNTVMVNIANHSGKFVALSGIVGVTTESGIVYVDASRFTVTVANGSEYGTFANDIFTLNANALNGSTYEITFDYNVDGISYVIDGEAGIKQTASAIDANGKYNVVTTVNTSGNTKPIDLIFVVDVSAGAGDMSNAKLTDTKAEIVNYITNSFAVNNNVRVAIVTYADGYEVLAGGYITDKDAAVAAVNGITLATGKDGFNVTESNLQAGLYGARTLMNANANRAYTDVIVFKGSEPNAAYSKYNETSYNYSDKIAATADEANAAANYELDKMNASKEIVIDVAAEADLTATMTAIFDARNYINVNAEAYITVNVDEFTFVEADGVKVNGVAVEYTYNANTGLVSIKNIGTLKDDIAIEYTVELKNKVDGDYFVSDTSSEGVKVAFVNSISGERVVLRGVSARVNYNTTTVGATITVITYNADSKLNPIGMDGLTIKNFKEDAIIGQPVVYTVSGVTNLNAGTTYEVKAPIVPGYTLWDSESSVKTVVVPAEGDNVVVYFGYYASGAIVDDSIVYDDSSAVVFDVLANDSLDGEKFTAIYGIGVTEVDAIAGNTGKVETAYGDLIIVDGGKVRFAPKGITVNTELYYSVKDGDVVRVGKIYIVPATIVKADVSNDTQVQLSDDTRWQIVDNDRNVVDPDHVSDKNANDAEDIYGGYENDDSGKFGFDGDDALYANRYQDYVANNKVDGTDAQYTATFSFTGTGFDIISVTGRAGGYITIKTYDSNGDVVSKASGNISTFAQTDNIYQATIFTSTDLAYGDYTVEVTALRTYLPRIGMTDTQVYVDSVRTYNPFANNTNEHYNELQDGTVTKTLKSIFVDGKLAVNTGGNGLFTQSGNLDINSYMNKGTNNAINIDAGKSLLFKLDAASARTTFQVEMAAVDSAAAVEVYVNSKLVETIAIDTGVFAYYDFSKYIREDSTVNFKVTSGVMTFSKVRYKDAVLGEPEGEKYTTSDLAYGTAPDAERMSAEYTVNTARLVTRRGTSRTLTALVYTSTNANSVVAYAGGYRIAPSSVIMKTNATGTQNQFMITIVLPDDVSVGDISIDFYAFDSANNAYSAECKTATYTLN